MTAGSILTMIIVLAVSWGGAIYFINMAAKAPGSDET
ncbi:MAG TPA: MetS family NSS transporter small subunit [Thermoanaerobacterales bacterium]|jgi:hypothetical protein|nr:MetS family NSS transporter small subunit [Thermoanaerobacterales bacterium]